MSRLLSRSKNPIHRARKLTGQTLAEASTEAGCHLQAFFLQEQGAYPDVLPKIAAWIIYRTERNMKEVTDEYHSFQRDKRRDNGESYGFTMFELGPPERDSFIAFRRSLGLSRMGFAKHFCVHPGLLYRLEQGISQTLPDQLATALKDAGLPERVLDELRYRIEEEYEPQ